MNSFFEVNIVGAGLAGSELAWQLATRNIAVNLYEMRDENRKTFAHRTENLAELVCSNSLRSDEITTAIGLLHQEMRTL
ncbi:MAG: FAD-dependent oxidoreductase, partial [Alphaproteobacteria bacterium]